MKCSRCGKEISKEDTYMREGKAYCEDCLMDIGFSSRECDPWATYIDKRTKEGAGQTGAESLNDVQKKIYELVKKNGRATRSEVMKSLRLSDAELKAHLTPLMHADLIKERSEGGTM
ncbi:MAG: winged helix-turn-helix transcriptional regulator, partial [Crenarchaeota archaeon]|nr:winged helix-turn-helix transcriptional regulator [Thermoproteota archaeon]